MEIVHMDRMLALHYMATVRDDRCAALPAPARLCPGLWVLLQGKDEAELGLWPAVGSRICRGRSRGTPGCSAVHLGRVPDQCHQSMQREAF